ncbi:hypothetical protein TWF506_003230 [Arthrobotrys conoides]|uniref:Uncharacterized protein n=1 Tax=Arthrobotrys conoides TaxID=74498 RepID=A0AAN8N534_9PEZI
MSENTYFSPPSVSPATGAKLESIPEGIVPTTSSCTVSTDKVTLIPISSKERLDAKIGLLRDMIKHMETFNDYDGDKVAIAKLAARVVNEFDNDIIHVYNLSLKIVTDTSREIETLTYISLENLHLYSSRYKTILDSIIDIPTLIKAAIDSNILNHLPAQESIGYKTKLESRTVKLTVLRSEVENKLISVEAKIDHERRLAFDDDFTLVSRKKPVKREDPNPYDTRPKRFQSSHY